MTVLEVVALFAYAAFLSVLFGWRTVEAKRRTGESAWRRPISRTDAVGETLCAAACVVSLGAPVLALPGVVAPVGLGGVGLRLVVTVLTLTCAIALGLWAQHHLASEWRAGIEPSGHLVTTGPFAQVRNPFYLACLVASVGVAVAVPSIVSLCGVMLHVVASEVIVRGVEEPVLARTHPEEFKRYRRRTGRFLPSPRAIGRS
ncbi:MAG: methyltransferase family protein [Acidimicrobiales bacterium]